MHDKQDYFIHIRNLKEASNQGLILKKVHKIIKLNQNAWLKLYIDMNIELRKKMQKVIFFRLRNNAVFGECKKT